jgi:endoglucanase
VRKIWRERVEKHADTVTTDVMGNCIAILNPKGSPRVLLAGHADEIGFQITHISDKGFLHFTTIGGHDLSLIPGRRVLVHTKNGPVPGVIGKKAIHLMTEEERKKTPEVHEMWIDIGAKDKEEAAATVRIGDSVTHDMGCQELMNGLVTARALDDRAGAFVAAEALVALAQKRSKLKACVMAVATVQEEIGSRGVGPITYAQEPDVGICIDVTHATDTPSVDPRKTGELNLGEGPRLVRGASVNERVFQLLCETAERTRTPYKIGATPGLAPNDTRFIQIARAGVASGTVGIPLRYMHTPCEVVSLEDLDNAVKLLSEFCLRLGSKCRFAPD